MTCPYGIAHTKLVKWPHQPNILLEQGIVDDLHRLYEAAANDGLALKIISGFRSFSAQQHIWHAKCSGQRPVLDLNDNQVDINLLSTHELIEAICLWSAIPGASRHHWGSDLDIIAQNLAPEDYKVQLTNREFGPSGPFNRLNLWCDEHLQNYGFFRPYAKYSGGIGPEPWHISHRSTAAIYRSQWNIKQFVHHLATRQVPCFEEIVAEPEYFVDRFVRNNLF